MTLPFANSRRAAFTLVEMMVAMAVMSLAVAGIVSANLVGLRMYQISENKMLASTAARVSLGRLTDEIRSSSKVQLGNINSGIFTALVDGVTQSTRALVIYPTASTNSYVLYFLNATNQLVRTTSTPGNTAIMARSITNSVVFRAQDFRGNVLTNNRPNKVVYIDLECYRTNRAGVPADYFKLESAVTTRN